MELMESQKMLGDIANDVRRIQVGQKELDVNLDTIFAYQNELNSTLSVRSTSRSIRLFLCYYTALCLGTRAKCRKDVRIARSDARCS